MLRSQRRGSIKRKMKVLFGTIAKNIEGSFQNLLAFASELFALQPDADLYLYENNSTDATRAFFPLLESCSPHVHVHSEDFTAAQQLAASRAHTWDKKPCRIEMIAVARNKLLEMMAPDVGSADYVVLFDADMAQPLDAAAILHTLLDFPVDADAIFANGLSANGLTYYDMYALRTHDRPCGPEILGETFWKTLPRQMIRARTPVYSAFGGLGLYRAAAVRGARYSAFPTPELNALYHRVASPMPPHDTHYNGALLGTYLFEAKEDGGFFYYNNSGYAAPIVCEHSTFHADMAARGTGRFYIDPALTFWSTHSPIGSGGFWSTMPCWTCVKRVFTLPLR